ncbi:hypothetical protein B4W73_05600 [Staphylococcus delphini]|nr:hypothetical protein B5B98_03985 [Staphylococcus delphini]PCF75036.1 hypothetical protein B4W73_05600 [Staphylococcus delphini]
MNAKINFLSIVIILFITLCSVLYISSKLPPNEIQNIQNLLHTDGIRAYSFFGLLLVLLLISVTFIYIVAIVFLHWVTFNIFRLSKVNNIKIIPYIYLINIGVILLENYFFNIKSNHLVSAFFNPAIILWLIFTIFIIFKNSNKIYTKHIVYIMFLYVWMVLFNIFILGGSFQ